ncbi:response regulator [Roseateles sp. DC23W]|uniref:Response regulator n=1 Tax=Pelomonas dachongensis TaxID=3299029 RepID=A0ABW7ERU2_9BURK
MQLILVVEDEYGAAEVMELVLAAQGYRVASAPNGKAALDLLATEKPAVIVSDFMMPHMNGAELGTAVRANSAWSDIPFVFVSGTSEEVVGAAFSDYDCFLSKPADVNRLLGAIRDFIGGRKPRINAKDVNKSMRHLLKGIEIPPDA